jgi:putative multiple sugar transport system substrate-binding protein
VNRKSHRQMLYTIFSITISILLAISVAPLASYAAPLQVADPNGVGNGLVAETQVGVVLPNQDYQGVGDLIQANLTPAGYTTQVLFSQDNSDTEKTNVEALISQGISVLIICPVDASAAAAAAEEARAAGIKVISFISLIRDTEAVDYYVLFDSVEVGELLGQYLVDHATGIGNPLFLYAGGAFDTNSFQFFEGAWNVLQPKFVDGTFIIKNSSEAVALTLCHADS